MKEPDPTRIFELAGSFHINVPGFSCGIRAQRAPRLLQTVVGRPDMTVGPSIARHAPAITTAPLALRDATSRHDREELKFRVRLRDRPDRSPRRLHPRSGNSLGRNDRCATTSTGRETSRPTASTRPARPRSQPTRAKITTVRLDIASTRAQTAGDHLEARPTKTFPAAAVQSSSPRRRSPRPCRRRRPNQRHRPRARPLGRRYRPRHAASTAEPTTDTSFQVTAAPCSTEREDASAIAQNNLTDRATTEGGVNRRLSKYGHHDAVLRQRLLLLPLWSGQRTRFQLRRPSGSETGVCCEPELDRLDERLRRSLQPLC